MDVTIVRHRKQNCPKLLKFLGLASVVALAVGCSGSESSSQPAGSGGSPTGGSTSATGAAVATGGSTTGSQGTGGTPAGGSNSVGGSATGGAAVNTGGSLNTGGSSLTGGAMSTGGASTTGGANSATGGYATGGVLPTGGRTSTGGNAAGGNATGGRSSTGGVSSTGGANPTGGASQTGGSKATGGSAATGGVTSTGGATSSCAIPAYNSASPPTTLALTGNLGTHDPVIIQSNGVYYQFATGNGIGTKTSTNLTSWTGTPDVFSAIPSWVAGMVPGNVTNIWAPDVSYFGGQFHLYYSVSTFGSNKSCIGHATRASLSTGSWADHGAVICSNVTESNNWNAIDPNVIVDDAGTPWMAFGSFWNGIMLIKLDSTGARADTAAPQNIARNSSIEGAYIIHQCGYYYLFVSFGACCDGAFDYNMRVGRSTSVTGPYLDKNGTNMLNGGGTLLVQGNSTWTAPGHNAILITANGAYNVYHALNSSHANPTLRIAQLTMDAQGWPVSGGP